MIQKNYKYFSQLKEMVKVGLKNFYKVTSHKPAALIFFRPGTNENEIQRITGVEMKMIYDACRETEDTYR